MRVRSRNGPRSTEVQPATVHGSRRVAAGAILCAAPFLLSPAALGQDAPAQQPEAAPAAPATPADIPGLIRDLDSPSVQTRIAAQTRLSSSPGISLHDIESAFGAAELSPEQRERLLSAAFKRFSTEPRGAMGVHQAMSQVDQQHGAEIELVAGPFPSATVLRSGDRVVAADGHPIANFDALRPVIVCHDPGDELPLTVVRAGATLNVRAKLASYHDLLQVPNQGQLPQPPTPDPLILARAWALRSKPLRDSSDAANTPIPCSLAATNWTQASYEDSDLIRGRVADPDQARTDVVAGGEARRGAQPAGVAGLGGVRMGGQVDGQIRIIMPQPQGADAVRVQLEQQRLLLIAMRQAVAEQVASYRQQLLDPNTPDAVKKQLRSQIELKMQELRLHDQRIQLLTTQLANQGNK